MGTLPMQGSSVSPFSCQLSRGLHLTGPWDGPRLIIPGERD